MRLDEHAPGSVVDVGRANDSAVVHALLAGGPMSRAAISDRIGLGRPTVTRVTTRLMEIGLLRAGVPLRSAPGRPEVPLEISPTGRLVGTISFGSAEYRVGLVDPLGNLLAEHRDDYSGDDAESAVGEAADRLAGLIEADGEGRRVLGVGATIGGWVDAGSGRLLRFAPRDWYDQPMAEMLRAHLDAPLLFDQTIRGLALAERMFGAAQGVDDFIEFWVGDVLGVAVVDRGIIRRGPRGAAGVAAHLPVREGPRRRCVCGRVGCLQASASDGALVEIARERGILDSSAGIDELVALVQSGRPDASRVVWDAASQLAAGFAAAVDLLNPSLVVVGGLLTETPQFLEAFRSTLIHEADRFTDGASRVALSRFGDLGPTIASASLVLDAYYRDPIGADADADLRTLGMASK